MRRRAGCEHLRERESKMAKYALYAHLKAKPGKEAEVRSFLEQGARMAAEEPGTVHWYGFHEDN